MAEGIGRLFDLVVGMVPVDTQTGTNTGDAINLKNAGGVTVVCIKAVGVGADDWVLTFRQSKTAAGGSIKDMTGLTARTLYKKELALLTGVGVWTAVAQAAGASVTLTGSATLQGIYALEFDASDLDVANGFAYFQANLADTGAAGAQLGCILYIPHELKYPRSPASLPNLIA